MKYIQANFSSNISGALFEFPENRLIKEKLIYEDYWVESHTRLLFLICCATLLKFVQANYQPRHPQDKTESQLFSKFYCTVEFRSRNTPS